MPVTPPPPTSKQDVFEMQSKAKSYRTTGIIMVKVITEEGFFSSPFGKMKR